jgi:hypothetical protein
LTEVEVCPTNGKIDALNIALKDFINSIKGEDTAVDIRLPCLALGENEAR